MDSRQGVGIAHTAVQARYPEMLFCVHPQVGFRAVCHQVGHRRLATLWASIRSGSSPSQQSGLCSGTWQPADISMLPVVQLFIYLNGRWLGVLPEGCSCGSQGTQPRTQPRAGQAAGREEAVVTAQPSETHCLGSAPSLLALCWPSAPPLPASSCDISRPFGPNSRLEKCQRAVSCLEKGAKSSQQSWSRFTFKRRPTSSGCRRAGGDKPGSAVRSVVMAEGRQMDQGSRFLKPSSKDTFHKKGKSVAVRCIKNEKLRS